MLAGAIWPFQQDAMEVADLLAILIHLDWQVVIASTLALALHLQGLVVDLACTELYHFTLQLVGMGLRKLNMVTAPTPIQSFRRTYESIM